MRPRTALFVIVEHNSGFPLAHELVRYAAFSM